MWKESEEKYFDGLCENETLNDAERHFKDNVLHGYLDIF